MGFVVDGFLRARHLQGEETLLYGGKGLHGPVIRRDAHEEDEEELDTHDHRKKPFLQPHVVSSLEAVQPLVAATPWVA